MSAIISNRFFCQALQLHHPKKLPRANRPVREAAFSQEYRIASVGRAIGKRLAKTTQHCLAGNGA